MIFLKNNLFLIHHVLTRQPIRSLKGGSKTSDFNTNCLTLLNLIQEHVKFLPGW